MDLFGSLRRRCWMLTGAFISMIRMGRNCRFDGRGGLGGGFLGRMGCMGQFLDLLVVSEVGDVGYMYSHVSVAEGFEGCRF